MARIFFEGDGRVARDRMGKPFRRHFLCVDAHGVQLHKNYITNGQITRPFHPGTKHTILMALLLSPDSLSTENFISLLWPNPDDEPEWADNSIKVQLSSLRRLLAPFGLSIANRYKWGYKICTLAEFEAQDNVARKGRAISNSLKRKAQSHA